MTTVVNAPPAESSGGSGFLFGVVIIVVLLFLFMMYGFPALRQQMGTPQINIPDKVDVNINQPK